MDDQQLHILADISACNARIAGYQAANQACLFNGKTPEYTEEYFRNEAATLEHLSMVMR